MCIQFEFQFVSIQYLLEPFEVIEIKYFDLKNVNIKWKNLIIFGSETKKTTSIYRTYNILQYTLVRITQ